MATGLNKFDEFLDHFENIEEINLSLYKQATEKDDMITSMKQQLSNIKKQKQDNTIKYYNKEPELTKAEVNYRNCINLSEHVQEVSKISEKETESLLKFMVKIDNIIEWPVKVCPRETLWRKIETE